MSTLGELRLAVDDLVVYGSHGVGRIAKRRQEMVEVEFERGLSVTLPIARAVECLRPLSTELELASISRTLGGPEVAGHPTWQRRLKDTRSKLAGGDAAGLAEVVRDAKRREERANAQKESSKLSLTEKQLYLTARKLLADEVGAARGLDAPSADAWIGEQLAHDSAQGSSREVREPTASVSAPAGEMLTSSGRRARRRRH